MSVASAPTATATATATAAAAPALAGSMNWEPVRKRLLGADVNDALKAATELRENIEIVHSTEFPLMLSALLPAFSSVLANRTRPTPDTSTAEHKFRNTILDIISKMPANEILRPHAPHLVAVAIDILNRDYEENALLASRIIFDLYKVYRSLPQDYVQPYVDFVVHAYRSLPVAIQRNFNETETETAVAPTTTAVTPSSTAVAPSATAATTTSETTAETPQKGTTPDTTKLSLRSNVSFRVLTECPLMVMLMFQLYPKYVHANIPVLIRVMMEALAHRPPHKKLPRRARELVAAQAKTLSFLTYLLRSFASELKQYEDRLANNVVALITICPREAVGTRKELLVATRHLLNSDFRKGFFRHVDVLLDERILMGRESLLRPLGYTTVSDLVQHVRNSLTMPQMSRVVGMFSRVLHDAALPLSTQYIAVRTLLSVVDIIFHNADPNPQLGRDLLVRTLQTMVQKLESLVSDGISDSVRDIQSMIRAIVVGFKTNVYYLHNYRREKPKVSIPASSNEEVSSALLPLTHTEVAIIDRYIQTALGAIPILKHPDPHHPPSRTEKTLVEQHRDALTYFASAFTALDGYTLRRTLGKRLDLIFDALVDDPTVMVVPRHLLASNATTSFEFCSILLEYLLEHIDVMSFPRAVDLVFCSPCSSTQSAKEHVLEQVNRVTQLPAESIQRLQKKSTTFLQLFERVLKSLAVFPENEVLVRKQLRRIVTVCLRCSMENTAAWPDSYCMLLRYVFRSISAGKFEESYRELLPLIPAVLNGLYSVISVSKDSVLLHTAIELCLTIPARLSSLLPHLNLLLRIIVLSLDSSSGDLVNLGYVSCACVWNVLSLCGLTCCVVRSLRTLEFWVDNLNPLFLYPEISKQIQLFSGLMQSLSRHLRPAPYPYGLLTLRLLGKLGGKNREFLREPMPVAKPLELSTTTFTIRCKWNKVEGAGKADSVVEIPIPLDRCVHLLKLVAFSEHSPPQIPLDQDHITCPDAKVKTWSDRDLLWTCRMSDVDFTAYNASVSKEVKYNQATASLSIAQAAIQAEMSSRSCDNRESRPVDDAILQKACIALLYAGMIKHVKGTALSSLKTWIPSLVPSPLNLSLTQFLSEAPSGEEGVALEVLRLVLALKDEDFEELVTRETVLDSLVVSLCDGYTSSAWSKHEAFQDAIYFLVDSTGEDWRRKHELRLVNTAFVVLKSTPHELSSAAVRAASFAIRLCRVLYGVSSAGSVSGQVFIWDSLPLEDMKDDKGGSASGSEGGNKPAVTSGGSSRPCEDAFRVILQDLASTQQLAR
jgi:transformation/transcription domain-associated protein